MIDSFYHMTIELLKNRKKLYWRENIKIMLSFAQGYNGRNSLM